MTRTQIVDAVNLHNPGALAQYIPEVLDAFVVEMRGKFYGYEETAQAFSFFVSGFNAGMICQREGKYAKH